MEFRKAGRKDVPSILTLIQDTIRTVYPRYYLPGIVDYFLDWHSRERVAAAVEAGQVAVLLDGGRLVGTGSREGNYIGRLFVLPECQGRGWGSLILARLEAEAAKEKHTAVWLSASLPAVCLYDRRGYRTVEHRREETKDGSMLVWDVMEKQLREE